MNQPKRELLDTEINRIQIGRMWDDARSDGKNWVEFMAWCNSKCNPQPDGDAETRFIGGDKR